MVLEGFDEQATELDIGEVEEMLGGSSRRGTGRNSGGRMEPAGEKNVEGPCGREPVSWGAGELELCRARTRW